MISSAPFEPALLTRLAARVQIDEPQPRRRELLQAALAGLLGSSCARQQAEAWLATGCTARITFAALAANGGQFTPTLSGLRALSDWQEGVWEVSVNAQYLTADADFVARDLAPTLSHELLGHGLSSALAAAADARDVWRLHELSELHARLVGWLVDFELDGCLQESGAADYFEAPDRFLAELRFAEPAYALLFSDAEIANPIGTLHARLAEAWRRREAAIAERDNNMSWLPVIEHFVVEHGMDDVRFETLRTHIEDSSFILHHRTDALDDIIARLAETIRRSTEEPHRASTRYLQAQRGHSFLAYMAAETKRLDAALRAALANAPGERQASHTQPAPAIPDGQIDFAALHELMQKDQIEQPGHWGETPSAQPGADGT